MSRQGGLFDEDKPHPHGLEWQHAKTLALHYPDDADTHGYYFERNVWRLLEHSPHWPDVQKSELEAALWLIATAQHFNEFLDRAIEDSSEVDGHGVLHNEFDISEEDLARHLLGYGSDEIESFGFPSFDTVSPHDAINDRLSTLRSRVRTLIKEAVGAPELRLNFYRDPVAWGDRLKGVALPAPDAQNPLELVNGWDEVMRFIERGESVPPLPTLPDWFSRGWPGILRSGHDLQFAENAWQLLRRSGLAPKLNGPREEAILWALMLRLSYGGFLEVAIEEFDDRSVLTWLEGFGVPLADIATHLSVEAFLTDEDTEALEDELFRASATRGGHFAVQLGEDLPATA